MPEYGYTPEIVKKKEIELKIYEQLVENIDIRKVIDAVNDQLPPLQVVFTIVEVVGFVRRSKTLLGLAEKTRTIKV